MPEDDADGRKMCASFILGVALLLKRPVAVVECFKGKHNRKKVYDTVRVYGARSADDRLVLTRATPDAQSTVDTFVNTTVAVLVESVRKNPMSHAVILYNGTDHFDPWVHTMRVSSVQRSLFDMAAAVEEEGEKEKEKEFRVQSFYEQNNRRRRRSWRRRGRGGRGGGGGGRGRGRHGNVKPSNHIHNPPLPQPLPY